MATKEDTFVVNPQYQDVFIFHKPRLTLASLIKYIATYPSKSNILRTFTQWHTFKVSYLFAIYMQIYLREKISKECKYDILIDKYYENIPSISEISTNYRPYLDHIVSQIPLRNIEKKILSKHDLRDKFHVYMNKRCIGPIKALSMTKKDLLIFGYVHIFRDEYQFYSKIIPWDVIKVIHLFFDKTNKEYLEQFEGNKRKIVEIEAEIHELKIKSQSKQSVFIKSEINSKQTQLINLYKKTNGIQYQEEYFPHLVDEYLVDTKDYSLKAKTFAKQLKFIPYTAFEIEYKANDDIAPFANTGLDINGLLLSLLKNQIMKQKFIFITKHKLLKDQLNIYASYISGINSSQRGIKYMHSHLADEILQLFNKTNKWTESAETTISYNSTVEQNQFFQKKSRDNPIHYLSYHSKNRLKPKINKTVYSFTID